jgi:hypothetical protein
MRKARSFATVSTTCSQPLPGWLLKCVRPNVTRVAPENYEAADGSEPGGSGDRIAVAFTMLVLGRAPCRQQLDFGCEARIAVADAQAFRSPALTTPPACAIQRGFGGASAMLASSEMPGVKPHRNTTDPAVPAAQREDHAAMPSRRSSVPKGDHAGSGAGQGALRQPPEPPLDPLEAELVGLKELTLDDLRRRWRRQIGRQAPPHLPKFLLLRMLAYRMQADVYGDLDRDSQKLLGEIARSLKAGEFAGGSGKTVPPVKRRLLKPGTILVREHDGALHRVVVMEKGFAWNGISYDSLSAIAKSITGTSWNGPWLPASGFGTRSPPPRNSLRFGGAAAAAFWLEGADRCLPIWEEQLL